MSKGTGDLGRDNQRVAWVSMAVGAATGLTLGLWSFDGPAPVPAWLGEYDDTSRRMARLGHIAFFGLGLVNLALAANLPRFALGPGAARAASRLMNFGNVFLPLTLFAAAAHRPLKYLMPFPAVAVFLALALAAWGSRGAHDDPQERDA